MSSTILATTKALDKETLELEPFAGLDGQGLPSYSSPVEFDANVIERNMPSPGREFVVDTDGSRIDTPVTLYVEGDETNVPDEQDRVTIDSEPYIVVERLTYRGLGMTRSQLDHIKLRLREE